MSHERKWSADDIPDLSGNTSVVTGANSEVGLEIAEALTRHRARIVLACRNIRGLHSAFSWAL